MALTTRTGERHQEAAFGDGPVDAVYKAIERVTGVRPSSCATTRSASVSTGEDAQGEVTVEVEHDRRRTAAGPASTDIVEASARAYLEVVNRVALKIPPPISAQRSDLGSP